MIGDLLLTWISELGSGTIADFRSRAAWLARTENLELPDSATGRWLRDASSLGHCEVDWKHGRWSVAPPVITRLPLADGLAVLTGARRARAARVLEEAGVYFEQARRPASEVEIPPPATILIPSMQTSDLEEAAAALGASFAGCAAAMIASMLRPMVPTLRAAPPAYDSPFEQLGAFSPRVWVASSPRDSDPPDGLYREQVHGRWQHLVRRDAAWYAADLSTGLFAELGRLGDTVIRWRPDYQAAAAGTTIIDWGAPLPPLHSRALVLCSGFAPRFGPAAETALYDNVPREIAANVATSLGQTLQITS
jgi:hypothetical protein